MPTRKHRKWYRLHGMQRADKFEGVIETPFAIYYLDPIGELHTVASGPCVILCRGNEPAVDKTSAAKTSKYPMNRLYVWVGVSFENIEICRKHISELINAQVYHTHTMNFVPKELE